MRNSSLPRTPECVRITRKLKIVSKRDNKYELRKLYLRATNIEQTKAVADGELSVYTSVETTECRKSYIAHRRRKYDF